jgi:hypothetical protein
VYKVHREGCPALGLTCRDLQGVYTHRTRPLLTIHAVNGNVCDSVPLPGPSATSRRLQTTPSASTASRTTPIAALPHALVSTHVHHVAHWSVGTSHDEWKLKVLGGPLLSPHRPGTAPSIAPKLAQAPAPAILTAREHSQTTKSCSSSLQMAAASGGGTRGDQTTRQPQCCPSAWWLPPNARADCPSIAATAASSFPASMKGGTSTCGSKPPDIRNVYPCGKRECGEREGIGAGVAGIQVECSTIRRHCPCLITTPRMLVLPHAVSSLSILRHRGDGGESQQAIQTMPTSNSATLVVVLATHQSEGLLRDVHGERHDVAGAPPCGPRTALHAQSKFPEK